MKFEKFLKAVGTHGEVIKRDGENWLVCGGVGMLIPRGVENILGANRDAEKYASIVDILDRMELDDPLALVQAVLFDPAGNAKAIYRVFETELGDRVGIHNADYGLLEKKDLLGYGEIEVDIPHKDNEPEGTVGETRTIKYVLVFDYNHQVIGFITGSDKF